MVIIGFWEESNKDGSIIPDGCSIHLSDKYRTEYIENIYKNRTDEIPDSYERVVDNNGYKAYVSDGIYDKLLLNESIRLTQVEFKNLMNLEELIVEYL